MAGSVPIVGTSRCVACGSTLPESAQFCPACGAAQQTAVPILDLGTPTRAPADDDEPPDRTVATVVALVLGAIALLVVLSIVAGGDDDDQGADEASSSTTNPRSTATTLPRPTLDVPPVLVDGESLDPSFGMAAVSIRSNGTVVVADLGTGEERTLERIPVAPVQSAAWVGETFVVKSIGEDVHRLVLDGTNTWEALDIDDGMAVEPQWGGPPGLFWMFDPMGGSVGPNFALIGSEGPIRLLGGQPFNLWSAAGVIDGHAVINSPDGIVLLGEGGEARRYGYGYVLGTSGPYLVRRACDDELVCRLVVDDTSSGASTDFGPADAGVLIQRAVPSPDGTAVAFVVAASDGSATVLVRRAGNDQPVTFDAGHDDLSLLEWSHNGDGLIWWSESRHEVRSLRWASGEVTPEHSTVSVSQNRNSAGYEGLFVVPLADLPPGWAPNDG